MSRMDLSEAERREMYYILVTRNMVGAEEFVAEEERKRGRHAESETDSLESEVSEDSNEKYMTGAELVKRYRPDLFEGLAKISIAAKAREYVRELHDAGVIPEQEKPWHHTKIYFEVSRIEVVKAKLDELHPPDEGRKRRTYGSKGDATAPSSVEYLTGVKLVKKYRPDLLRGLAPSSADVEAGKLAKELCEAGGIPRQPTPHHCTDIYLGADDIAGIATARAKLDELHPPGEVRKVRPYSRRTPVF